jgi:hypothetical protein
MMAISDESEIAWATADVLPPAQAATHRPIILRGSLRERLRMTVIE